MKKILLISALLLIVGIVVSAVGLAMTGFDIKSIINEKTVRESFEFEAADIDMIAVNTHVSDVKIVESSNPDSTVRVNVTFFEGVGFSAGAADGRLTVSTDKRPWYMQIGIISTKTLIEIIVPYGFDASAVSINTNTGDVWLTGVDVKNAKIEVNTGDVHVTDGAIADLRIGSDTGDVELKAVTAEIIEIGTDTGDITMRGCTAGDRLKLGVDTGDIELTSCEARELKIKSSTGDVELDRCDAAFIDVETSTGDVEMTLLSGKLFDVDSSTGKKHIPASVGDGDPCRIRTSTGDIEVRIIE